MVHYDIHDVNMSNEIRVFTKGDYILFELE